jgi:hypothetical protein
MKQIYYLTYSDIPEEDGLIFPTELLDGSYVTGIWVAAFHDFEKIPELFEFDAVDNNELIRLIMTRVDGSVFQVSTGKHGVFYFRLMPILNRNDKYVGKSTLINSNSKLYQVVSMNIQKLEQTCLKDGFFFVGRVDNDFERRE